MTRLQGKVALITGAARGQGRSHAIRLAQEGADVIAIDICGQVGTVKYELGTPDDLEDTARAVKSLDRRVVALQADVRDAAALGEAVDRAVAELGHLDIVSANAGIFTTGTVGTISDAEWQDMLDVNLTGAWNTVKVAVPHIVQGGRGGSIILTSSSAGLQPIPGMPHYVAAKHGITGLTRALAQELWAQQIRVNSVHPGAVNTLMITNPASLSFFRPDLEDATPKEAFGDMLLDPVEISNALLFLASDESRYVTGQALTIAGGLTYP